MKKGLAATLLVFVLSSGASFAGEGNGPSALVRTEAMKHQAVSETLVIYGVVGVDPRSALNITLPRPGQVIRLMVTAGQIVGREAPLLELATDPADALAFETARNNVAFARSELQRTESLVAQKMATRAQLASAHKALTDAEGALRTQERIGAGRTSEVVHAPFAGVVTLLGVKPGDRVQAGVPLLQLSRRGEYRIELGVEPEDVAKVTPGMPIGLSPVSRGGEKAAGTIVEVHAMVNARTRLVDVVARVTGKESAMLMPGMQVQGVIALPAAKSWTIPRSAVLRDARGAYIFQVIHGRARRIDVRTGMENDGFISIQGGFDPRRKVVVLGNYELHDGMAVREGSR